MSKLLFIPCGLPEESPTSLLMRMAIRHGCRLPSDLQNLFGSTCLNGALISRSHPIIQSIATRAGAAGESFSSGFYESMGTLSHTPPLKIAGFVVSAGMIRKNGAAFCSECWSSDHEHYIKDLKLARYCPYHLRKYLTHCPHCHIKLYWHTPLAGTCRCKYELISPPCLPNEAANEQKLLAIFRTGATGSFEQLVKNLKHLGYPLELDTLCPINRCLLSMAFALIEDNMVALLNELRILHCFYPDVPKKNICAKIAKISHAKIRECMRTFLRNNSQERPEENISPLQPLPPFYLSHSQISAWLGLSRNQAKMAWKSCDIKSRKTEYTWNQAQAISQQVLKIRLSNGFKKKKLSVSGITTKELQQKLLLSAAMIKGAVQDRLFTPLMGSDRRVRFALDEVEYFSEKFMSIQLLSAQSQTTTSQIREALKRLKIPQLECENRTLRQNLIKATACSSIIEWASTANQKRSKAASIRFSLSLHTPNTTETWMPTTAAAEFLGKCESVVRHLIKAGLLPDVRRKLKGGGYLINILTLKKFKDQYFSASEVGALLGCNPAATTKILSRLDISPITGPGLDDNPSRFYSRKKVLKYASAGKRQQQKKSMGYTVSETRKKLHISNSMISNMIKTGLLKPITQKLQTCRLISKICVDKFYKHYAKPSTVADWLKIPLSHGCLYKVLNRFGISPVTGPPIDSSKARLYLINDIAKHFSIPIHTKSHNARRADKSPLVSTSNLAKKHNINAGSFRTLFLTSGYVDSIRVGSTTYLTHKDASKIESILKTHYTCAQASRYLGHEATNLLKSNQLEPAYPLKDYWDHPMINKVKLHNYAIKHRRT